MTLATDSNKSFTDGAISRDSFLRHNQRFDDYLATVAILALPRTLGRESVDSLRDLLDWYPQPRHLLFRYSRLSARLAETSLGLALGLGSGSLLKC